ncbi:hypothetical protein [Youxingia wuxianensis]|uniref:Uncharacterized protein n=1 Tax=Youxingia wuxianensis TaxID=2763678 RepID=A0A926IH89_9FIRM|nr:hypothetical protein [Youxingia wuxianensis]MBC8584458.1 hypothetical protein [Youxingia wuxianensis]
MVYAYVQYGTVMMVERRTEDSDDPAAIKQYYTAQFLPNFIPVPQEIKNKVRAGWLFDYDKGFHEPEDFEINPQTHEMYLPSSISPQDYYTTSQLAQRVPEMTIEYDQFILELDYRLTLAEEQLQKLREANK